MADTLPCFANIPFWAALRFNPDISVLLLITMLSQFAQAGYRLMVVLRAAQAARPMSGSSAAA